MPEQTWFFTFGSGHKYPNGYVRFTGTDLWDARDKMCERFGSRWAFQYTEEEFPKIAERWRMYEVIIDENGEERRA